MVADLEKQQCTMAKLFGVSVLYVDQRINLLDINKTLNGMYEDRITFTRYELGKATSSEEPQEVGVKYPDEYFCGTIITDKPLNLEIGDQYLNRIGLFLKEGDFVLTDKKYMFPIWRKIRGDRCAK